MPSFRPEPNRRLDHGGDGRGVDHWTDNELGPARIQICLDILGW